jgi:hypothetical protein
VRCAKGETKRDRQTHRHTDRRTDEMAGWLAGQGRTGQGRQAWQCFRVAAPPVRLPSTSLRERVQNNPPRRARTFNCPLRAHLWSSTEPSSVHLFCHVLPSLLPPRRPRALQAISRRLSPGCSIARAKWNNPVIIARSEGCHRCRPNHHISAKEASNSSAPMPAVRRYLLA